MRRRAGEAPQQLDFDTGEPVARIREDAAAQRVLAYVGVAVVLIAAGVAASAVPARRAMRLDPVTALQTE